MPPRSPAARRRFALVLALALGLTLAPLAEIPTAQGAEAADVASSAAAKAPPTIDRGLMLLGCMSGLAIGAVSVVLPPASAWVAAGVMGGGLGTMIVRAGFGCVYGALGGAVHARETGGAGHRTGGRTGPALAHADGRPAAGGRRRRDGAGSLQILES